jgi:NAD(P)-dependent dehydrogenase (short-subunit alcohol dehydrogenase family)
LVFAQELLAAGARKVYAAARNPERITLDEVDRVSLDVTKPDAVAAAARECTDVNLLINNAGIALWTGFLAADAVEAARAEMETNYFGPLLLSRAFVPILKKNGGGAIVNILSILSWIAVPDGGTYSASKAARLGFDKLAANRFAGARHASRRCACQARLIRIWRRTSRFPKSRRSMSLGKC